MDVLFVKVNPTSSTVLAVVVLNVPAERLEEEPPAIPDPLN